MYIVITASPNSDGLTSKCGNTALEGIRSAGGVAKLIDLNEAKIQGCLVCGNGWGECRTEGVCVIGDALHEIKSEIENAQGVVLVTPVYWGQPSEIVKYFLDRVRRCEGLKRDGSSLRGQNFILIAAAGGSGNGTVSCLTDLELWCRHVGAVPVERIGVTRRTSESMMGVIRETGINLVSN
jgi:multimeric flavodoxin WrbA